MTENNEDKLIRLLKRSTFEEFYKNISEKGIHIATTYGMIELTFNTLTQHLKVSHFSSHVPGPTYVFNVDIEKVYGWTIKEFEIEFNKRLKEQRI